MVAGPVYLWAGITTVRVGERRGDSSKIAAAEDAGRGSSIV